MILNLSLLWILILFGYQGNQFVKALRYFYPLYPFLALLSAWFIYHLALFLENRGKLNLFLVSCLPAEALAKAGFLFLVLVYPFSFISIYSRPHTRVTASNWIYQNIPPGSRISGEHWDDYLPLSLPAPGFIHENYQSVEFPLYNEDNGEKWLAMSQKLATTDYIILTSNRLYGSIMTVPEKYPVTAKFYQQLFAGNLGFEKVIEFTSRPNLPLPLIKICLTPPFIRYGIVSRDEKNCLLEGISFVDDYADETFTVYDHPKVLIFKKVKPVDYYQILYQNLNK
ncbi:hypothetical protein A2W14_03590 [Candidatus Gottesmanbacteria bacterium RBG_16_37_8]|uniref:Uncharacterized protein n=1 Tax=Candidatus Gottesmanbacteria bacterium RBG_16_37_8 TaxID=1798371 RepID=A0A1F5YSS4_9BACT|nr:MAG: hypothetical protein A2W14_03590 [Candidatus Gottesmanbacteria bacterium RBG_16_37_8]